MNGVESSTNAARMVRELSGYHGLLPVSGTNGAEHGSTDPIHQGALAAARTAVSDVLASSGFVDLTGPHQQNFEVYLTHGPVEAKIEDLKPGLLSDLEAWVRSQILGDAQQALQIQANVPSQGALKLLT
jgi:hypothetical protein